MYHLRALTEPDGKMEDGDQTRLMHVCQNVQMLKYNPSFTLQCIAGHLFDWGRLVGLM